MSDDRESAFPMLMLVIFVFLGTCSNCSKLAKIEDDVEAIRKAMPK